MANVSGAPTDVRSGRGTVSIQALGCKANREEMESLLSRLVEAGYRVVPFGEQADWSIVNTCTVTSAGDSDSRQMIRRATRVPGAGRVIVTGCLAQRDPRALAALPGVDWLVGNAEKPAISEWILHPESRPPVLDEAGPLCPSVLVGADPTRVRFDDYGLGTEGRRARASLKIQDGCDEHCTFCVIPSVRGASRSRPLPDVLRAARTLVASGYREIGLTGINTALWGNDLPGTQDLLELLGSLARVPGLSRIRLNSLEPQYVTDRWLASFAAEEKLCRHLHLPLQSGDDVVLRRMNRRYTTDEYADLLERASSALPGLAIGADVMVGFPGETAARFETTCRLLESMPLAYLHVFSYSPRPDTPAPRLKDAVGEVETRQRSVRLRALDADLRRRFARSRLGEIESVLIESVHADGSSRGTTGNYLRVRVRAIGEPAQRGAMVPVRLECIEPSGWISGVPAGPSVPPVVHEEECSA